MSALRAQLALAAERLGWSGVLGLGLLAFSAAFYLSTVRPGQSRLEHLRGEASRFQLLSARAARAEPRNDRERLKAFYEFFPPSDRSSAPLGRIFAVAESQALRLELGDYRVLREERGGLTQYQVTFPLKGTYPQVRKFVAAALARVPNLSLSSIQLERQKIGESIVNAKVKFVLHLGQRS